MEADAQVIANWVSDSKSIVAFSGAGISTESGIPDFRSPGGVWARTQPVLFDDFLRSAEARHEYWRQKSEFQPDISNARPNGAHQTLARWEADGRLRGVITQNIDGMHQLAGSQNVLELHGTAREVSCLDCGTRFAADLMVERFVAEEAVPDCPDCGGLLKHATISFGQSLSPEILHESTRWCREADLFLAIGSSLVVEPAASLPAIAKRDGARLVIINRDPTPLDQISDLVVNAGIGDTFKQIEQALL